MKLAVSTKENKVLLKPKKGTRIQRIKRAFDRGKYCYLMLLPVIVYYLIFHYWPMLGIAVAFQDYIPGSGFLSGPWVGLKNFIEFFQSFYFWRLIRNTFLLNFWLLVFSFPAPILLALLLNELRFSWFKRTVQMITYIPHFISIIIIVGLIKDFLSTDGIVNMIRAWFGYQPVPLLEFPQLFRTIYVSSDIWQSIGWSSIIYFAAMSAVNPNLYEAAEIDGAGRFKKMWHVTLPAIRPTIVILLILAIGSMMSSGFEKILLLYQPLTYQTADVIATYVFRKGIEDSSFSFATAVGLFDTIVNFTLLILANYFSRKFSENSLW